MFIPRPEDIFFYFIQKPEWEIEFIYRSTLQIGARRRRCAEYLLQRALMEAIRNFRQMIDFYIYAVFRIL